MSVIFHDGFEFGEISRDTKFTVERGVFRGVNIRLSNDRKDKTVKKNKNNFPEDALFLVAEFLSQYKKIHAVQYGRTIKVIWPDGKFNTATAAKDDCFDPEIGVAICIAKRIYAGKRGKKLFDRLVNGRYIQAPPPVIFKKKR